MATLIEESSEEQTVIITTSSKIVVPDKHHDTRANLKDLIELEVNFMMKI
jgi:hypothetical protein